ncbi:MAG: hypothetical protein ACOZNI_18815 [Myxococcota bacterium]
MRDWKVLPHGPLVQLAPRLWQLTGSQKGAGGIPRNMTIWRMESGGLWVHSAVAVDEDTLASVTQLGPPEVLVVPNGMHRLDAPAWKQRFPAMRVVAPAPSRAKVEEVVEVDALDTDVPGAEVRVPDGLKAWESCYALDSGAGTALVFCDALFNLEHQPGFRGWVLKTLGSTGKFGITNVGKLFLKPDAPRFAAWLRAQADAGAGIVCVAHGKPVTADVSARLREAADALAQ